MKICTKCSVNKSLDEFNNLAKAKDGKKPSCRKCQADYEYKRKLTFEAAGRPDKELAGTKECTKCNKVKSYSDFYRRGDASGTYKSQCKKCIRPILNQYKRDNPAKRQALKVKRAAALINRTPKWLTAEDFWLMEQAYEHAVAQSIAHGIKFNVAHIIPLQGKYVSGFHCPDNLQVIPAKENFSKGNKFTNPGIVDFILSLTSEQLTLAEKADVIIT